jgi:hypothetical protein
MTNWNYYHLVFKKVTLDHILRYLYWGKMSRQTGLNPDPGR